MGLFFLLFFCFRKPKKSKENLFMESEKSDLELDHQDLVTFSKICFLAKLKIKNTKSCSLRLLFFYEQILLE